jgi:hypothetical protein
MHTLLAVSLLVIATPALGSQISYKVQKGSELERELAYSLQVVDKHESYRALGIVRSGPAPEFVISYTAPATGKLIEFFGFQLVVIGSSGLVISAPLGVTRMPGTGEVRVEFTIEKALLSQATLHIRCGSPVRETTYEVQLHQYSPLEPQATAPN